jgi:predicted nucleic acid-binding protein
LKVLFDTSVLVSAFFEDLPEHDSSLAAWLQATDIVVAAHTLAELYATATRIPVPTRPTPSDVLGFVHALRDRASIVALDSREYASAIDEFAGAGHIGARIYDYLIARCALKARVDIICTRNQKHFRQFGPDIAPIVKTPADFIRQ